MTRYKDVKPSNILINNYGQIKIADFGVSGQLLTSLANTFVGTSAYMSPERIQGLQYSVQCDVWSLGLTLVELVTGAFPMPKDSKSFSVFELLQFVVNERIPTPPPGMFTPEFDALVARWYGVSL
jgi:mitogen-activated protein kinase kinase